MMTNFEDQRLASLKATEDGAPNRTSNPFFGVGPITDVIKNEIEARENRFAFDRWIEKTYRKRNDQGDDIGPFTTAEISRSMHRGYPADAILTDMMHHIHRYFGFPKTNKLAVGLGGGHSGFTVAVSHLMNPNLKEQRVFVDTPHPETSEMLDGGFFRQSWATQILEMQDLAVNGSETNIVFAQQEGTVPSAAHLEQLGISLFIGVGHETTGATTYTQEEAQSLLEWIDKDPQNRHAVIDATSLLGAMPWRPTLASEFLAKCCLYMPLQKAIGGVSGYFIASFTPAALELVQRNQSDPAWAIPRQFKLAVPTNPAKPLTSPKSVDMGPFFDPETGKMIGGVINTYSALAFAETTFGLLRAEDLIGSAEDLNARSAKNRDAIDRWLAGQTLLVPSVAEKAKRGAAVTLVAVADPDIDDPMIHHEIIEASKQLLGYEGLTHPNGEHEPGLDVARYVNAFPGTPGDYRAWIGGIRSETDIVSLFENLTYAYHRAKIVVLERHLEISGRTFPLANNDTGEVRKDDPDRAYKILIADHVGLKFAKNNEPDFSEVKQHIEDKGATFTPGLWQGDTLNPGQHFFYAPHLSTDDEFQNACSNARYEAIIAAASFLPENLQFAEGGVRIGAGTGNMACACWGGSDGRGGTTILMNTPSFNSRATAQMVFKAILDVCPDLPVDEMHRRVVGASFDTGKHLADFPTEKLEGKRLAVIGYGNIGREVAKLGKAFQMHVVVHAREHHCAAIRAAGFEYAKTVVDAADGADVLSPHVGLGPKSPDGAFANEGLVDATVLSKLARGAVLINYDRGEVVDAKALYAAIANGHVRFAAIDADIFVSEDGKTTGPAVPYLSISKDYPGHIRILPHAAADTDHPSRVAGAKQAVSQILDAIRFKRVVNVKGDLPSDYTDGGAKIVVGVGAVDTGHLMDVVSQATEIDDLCGKVERFVSIVRGASATPNEMRSGLLDAYGEELVNLSNMLITDLTRLGLTGHHQGTRD